MKIYVYSMRMEIQAAKILGFGLFKQFGVEDAHLIFDDATHRCGCCRMWFSPDGKVISKNGILAKIIISTRFIKYNSQKEVDDTIRHELSHYFCNIRHGLIKGFDGKRQSHGADWKKIALEVGAKPRSCTEGVYIPKFYQLVCYNNTCKLKGKKQYETNKTGDWPCKCCKKRLAVIPNDGKKIQPQGIAQVIMFE